LPYLAEKGEPAVSTIENTDGIALLIRVFRHLSSSVVLWI